MCSSDLLHHLSKYPEDVEMNCPEFKKTFPTILKNKLEESSSSLQKTLSLLDSENNADIQVENNSISDSTIDKLKDLIICGQVNKVKSMKVTKEGDFELDYK